MKVPGFLTRRSLSLVRRFRNRILYLKKRQLREREREAAQPSSTFPIRIVLWCSLKLRLEGITTLEILSLDRTHTTSNTNKHIISRTCIHIYTLLLLIYLNKLYTYNFAHEFLTTYTHCQGVTLYTLVSLSLWYKVNKYTC